MHALLAAVLLAGASPADVRPQFDLSYGITGPRRESPAQPPSDSPVGSLYVGAAITPDWPSYWTHGAFLGAGVEGTIDGRAGPYQWSAGFGPRVGYVWRRRNGPVDPFPDGYVYARVTPFLGMRTIAEENYLHDEKRIAAAGAGIRFGVGFTVPLWSRTVAEALGDFDPGPLHFNSPGEALACIGVTLAVVLFNHVELTWEIYSEPGLPLNERVGIRFGTGF